MSQAEGHVEAEIIIPKGALRAAIALVAFALLAAAVGRLTGLGTVRVDHVAAVQSVPLRFEDRADGGISVVAPDSGKVVGVVEAGSDGFLRTVLRSMAFDRQRHAIGSGPAFTINRWSDGRLSLDDPATGRRVDLAPFGADNKRRFTELMTMGETR
ncbi:photosynthetic complex assembly protein PuhC [Bradyrhizobium sp. HKCCYLS20291]|uniref:photosynthetic complex assembly protein PuhC n=1 Tax=Bradyrhizobium sp. HKCCYLS20291 TaxID=3420766 RepID=UPI003EBF3364